MMTRSLNTTLAATLACAAIVLASGTAQGNILINPGFDDDVRTTLGNNLNVSVTGWSTDAPQGSGFNNVLVKADGSYSYSGGPNVAQSGTQYLDLHGGSDGAPSALWQTFALPTDSDLTFSAYYSNREASTQGGRAADLGIYDAAGTTLLSSLEAVDLSGDPKPSTSWTQSPIGTASLPMGTYQVRTNMDGYLNIDSVVVDAQPTAPPPAHMISDLYNTGVVSDDEFGLNAVLVANGQADPHYQFVTGPQSPPASILPQAQVQANHPAWTANGPNSKWIGVTGNGTNNVAGTDTTNPYYVYETTFTIPTRVDPSTAHLAGYWFADNHGGATDILVNGISTGLSVAPFNAPLPGTYFQIDDSRYFQTGLNTLTFRVINPGGDNPHGLRVNQLVGWVDTVIPEPSTFLIWSLGLIALGWYGRRRRSK